MTKITITSTVTAIRHGDGMVDLGDDFCIDTTTIFEVQVLIVKATRIPIQQQTLWWNGYKLTSKTDDETDSEDSDTEHHPTLSNKKAGKDLTIRQACEGLCAGNGKASLDGSLMGQDSPSSLVLFLTVPVNFRSSDLLTSEEVTRFVAEAERRQQEVNGEALNSSAEESFVDHLTNDSKSDRRNNCTIT